ncbi:MAG TPA: translation elongation factor Ts [Bryobacteraceae bacterium]|jgi:elongation factor Ts|nr:translation elongation factor Ts [Bryobacteraceae bacterium]
MEISPKLVKELRDRTGAGIMECKSALVEAKGNLPEAEIILRKRGIASAAKKATRSTRQGVIGSYIHPGSQLGVLVEVNCESDFVARTDDFQQLVKDLAMQIAAADPQFIRKEDVTPDALNKERDIQRGRALQEGKPEKMIDKIIEGRMNKFYEEVCLYEQPFIRENSTTVGDLIKTMIAKVGENISVSRFVRFKVGEAALIEETADQSPPKE